MHRSPLALTLAAFAACCLGAAAPLHAQELRVQPTPFSVWLDLQAIASSGASKMALPIWMESLQTDYVPASRETAAKTTHRIRLRRLGHLNAEVQLRVFFDDVAGGSPVVSAWSETGVELFAARTLGAGVGLPTSERVTIPVADADYIDITVPGEGRNLRGIYLSTLRKFDGRHALDFQAPDPLRDPFGQPAPAQPSPNDSYLYGRVRATLDAGPIKLDPRDAPSTTIEFELDAPPLIAVLTFEVLNVDPVHPPELTINNRPLGRAALQLPDLADPGYRGTVRPLERDMRFEYTGWIRGALAIPGSALAGGLNSLILQLHRDSGPVAVRAVEIELKHPWQNLDYKLSP